jgi:AbrB family looped-hinge helix DNA binding protein
MGGGYGDPARRVMRSFRSVFVGSCAVAVVGAAFGIPAAPAYAAGGQACGASGYKLSLLSLTTPPRTDLVVRVTARKAGCELPDNLTGVQVAVLPFKKLKQRKVVVGSIAAPGATATINIGRVQRLRRVRATVTFGSPVVLTANAKTLLKPDLALTRAYAGRSAVIGRPFFVVAIVRNRTKDVGLGAVVSVSAAGAPLATKTVKVGPKGQVVIPKEIRDELGIEPGQEVLVDSENGEARVRRTIDLQGLIGLLRDGASTADLEEERRLDREREERKLRSLEG